MPSNQRPRRRSTRIATAVTAAVVPLALVTVPISASAAMPSTASTIRGDGGADPGRASSGRLPYDRTSALEARRVDRVPAPKFVWKKCTDTGAQAVPKGAQCATIRVPLDYDSPKGSTTFLGVARIRAAKPAQRIGTLFMNPGGPTGSSTDWTLAAPQILDQRLLDRFDLVGIDPRGINRSENLRCFSSNAAAEKGLDGLQPDGPTTPAQIRPHLASTRALGKACGTTGRRLASHMSTAEVARDMDVVRRALGDRKLTYLGFSYGSQLGQVYANMFPDRVRALVIDGVTDPVAWTGAGPDGRRTGTFDRMRTADGNYRALREFMRRCDRVGKPACAFAGSGNSMAKFDQLMARLAVRPVTYPNGGGGTETETVDSAANNITFEFYKPRFDARALTRWLQTVWTASEPTASAAQRAAARTMLQRVRAVRAAPSQGADYENTDDAFAAIVCTDGVHPRDPQRWVATAKAAARRAPYFGRSKAWQDSACAEATWLAHDEDRYLGPFTRRTAAPVLVVGNYWDPATSHLDGAVRAAKLLPNSRLLSSNSWGHTAYGTSKCATDAIGAYLIKGTLPAKGTVCTGPQPFDPPATAAAGRSNAAGGAHGAATGDTARPSPITGWPVRRVR